MQGIPAYQQEKILPGHTENIEKPGNLPGSGIDYREVEREIQVIIRTMMKYSDT